MFNYYCRILSQHNENPEPITTNEFEKAKLSLSLFNYWVILEDQKTFWGLNQFLGWKEQGMRQNQAQLKIRRILKSIKKGKFTLKQKQYKEKPNPQFVQIFREFNKFDYQLYAEAKTNNLALSYLNFQ